VHGAFSPDAVKLFKEIHKVLISDSHQEMEHYRRYFFKFHRVFFLYDTEIFRDQSSGRLCDAVLVNSEIVVPRDSALEDMAREYGDFESFSFDAPRDLATLMNRPKVEEVERRVIPTPAVAINRILETLNLDSQDAPRDNHEIKVVVVDLLQKLLFLNWIFAGIRRRISEIIRA
jgi:hypothetical protein